MRSIELSARLRNIGAVFLACAALLMVLPANGLAQDCARCVDCWNCDPGWWGGNECDYKGPPSCPCRERGGNCNPDPDRLIAQGVLPSDLYRVDIGSGDELLLVRVDESVYAAWDCEGLVSAVLRMEPDGNFTELPIGPPEYMSYSRSAYLARRSDG